MIFLVPSPSATGLVHRWITLDQFFFYVCNSMLLISPLSSWLLHHWNPVVLTLNHSHTSVVLKVLFLLLSLRLEHFHELLSVTCLRTSRIHNVFWFFEFTFSSFILDSCASVNTIVCLVLCWVVVISFRSYVTLCFTISPYLIG